MVQTISIGKTDLKVPPLGLGTWQWGDRGIWQYGVGYGQNDVEAAYRESRAAGITFFDTAELYGSGVSEQTLGPLVRAEQDEVTVATKFAPWPYRLTAKTLPGALDGSLKRLGLARIDLYQVHWPWGSPIRIEALMDVMADQVEAGKIRAVGVSNYSEKRMRRAHAALAKRGIALASNQVEYSLLHRQPERSGVLAACQELDVRLIAYSPLAKGALTGKYHDGATVSGIRKRNRSFRPAGLQASAPLIKLLAQVGEAHGGKTPAQVALNWLIHQGALPIPGAKNASQAASNAGALGWDLTDEECAQISEAANKAIGG
ncbi:MAG TPA: aldo/keto reductase [Ktedonobacterales bacterium]|jgi:aryl-alcohol dehydrogenase-like predicted oxidoreductase